MMFGKVINTPRRKLSQVSALRFVKTQSVKTWRNPGRVPALFSYYSAAMMPRVVAWFRSLPGMKTKLNAHSLGTGPISPVVVTYLPQVDSVPSPDNPRAAFRAGVAALNNVRIADAVRLLAHAANMHSDNTVADDLWLKREAYRHLGLALHHGLGRLDEAITCWREANRLSQSVTEICHAPIPSDVEIYDPFWSNHIGHTAILGIMMKRELLFGKNEKKRYLICSSEHNIGNRYLVEQMGRFYNLIQDSAQFHIPREYEAAFCKLFWIDNRLSGPATYPWQVLAEITRAWEAAGRGPLLRFTAEELDTARRLRTEMGVPQNAWHVCLHVRSSGYKLSHDDLHATLNADIRTYDRAMAAVVRRGGWVIRMGDPSMPKLSSMKNVIDYAHSPQKSPEMDVFLCGTCRFFIGTSSGPSLVPGLYGVPSVITNWFPTGTRPLNSGDLFIPKLHWYEREEEFAPFDESMSQPLGHLHALPILAELGLSLRSNIREELADVVEEMLDRLDGGTYNSTEDQQLQAYFERVALQSRSYGNARVGRDFLRKYQHLLPFSLAN
jgi:putative glycosyltransferase (TIGR04372 family)